MDHTNVAKLLVALPPERFQVLSPGGRPPQVGDIVALDQGYTGPDGLPMVLAYFPAGDNGSIYEAMVYESELT